jgi:hypothetical protein
VGDGAEGAKRGGAEARGAFRGPGFVGVVEEGFAVVGEDDAGWGDGYGGVVLPGLE